MPLKGNFEEFAEAIGQRESGGNYKAKNKFGYLGRYQFGMARLCDLGLTQRKPNTVGFRNEDFEWISPYSEDRFLQTQDLQDATFKRHVNDLKVRLEPILSGLVAGVHLLGIGGLRSLLFEGKVSTDGFGTPITDYIKEFSGYGI